MGITQVSAVLSLRGSYSVISHQFPLVFFVPHLPIPYFLFPIPSPSGAIEKANQSAIEAKRVVVYRVLICET